MEEGKTFVVVNELDVKFNSKEGQLNDLLTEEVVKIEQKGKDTILLPNLRRWYFTTNTSAPCRLSRGQRRVFVIRPPKVGADTRGAWGIWVREVVAKWRKDEAALGYIRAWFDKLWMEEGEGNWDATAPVPQTEEGDEASEASMTKTDIIAHRVVEYIRGCKNGWSAVHPDYKIVDNKIWGQINEIVKEGGGYVMQKERKQEGINTTFTVYDTEAKLPRKQKSNGGYRADVDGDEVAIRADKLKIAMREIKYNILGGDRDEG
jgi:hypothetical protein